MTIANDRLMRADFREYLISKCGLKKSTANAYIDALNRVSDLLNGSDVISGSIYDIRNLHELQLVREAAKSMNDYRVLNEEKHRNCEYGLSHYYDFAACNWKFSHKWDIRIYH